MGSSWVDYVYIPLVPAIGVLVLGLVLRWSRQSGSSRAGSRVADATQGLLIGVVSTTPAEAERLRGVLTAAGVRATSRPVAARRQVLVWPDDVDTALRVISADRAEP